MGIAFKVMSLFWILSPVGHAIGLFFGVWNSPWDWAIFLGLSAVSTFVLFLNYTPNER